MSKKLFPDEKLKGIKSYCFQNIAIIINLNNLDFGNQIMRSIHVMNECEEGIKLLNDKVFYASISFVY